MGSSRRIKEFTTCSIRCDGLWVGNEKGQRKSFTKALFVLFRKRVMDITAKASIDANISEGICPSCVGLTSNALPEVQTPNEETNSQTGLSTRNAPIITIKRKPKSETISNWYAIRCTYGRERKAYEFFSKQGIEAFYPTITSAKTTEGKKETIEESRLPNILFAFGTFEQLKVYVYDNHHDDTKFLRFYYNLHHDGTKEPLIVPMSQMILKKICNAEVEDKQLEPFVVEKYKEGQLVRVIEGPFVAVEGIVKRYKEQQRVGIVIDGLFTITTAYIAKDFLQILDKFDTNYGNIKINSK